MSDTQTNKVSRRELLTGAGAVAVGAAAATVPIGTAEAAKSTIDATGGG